MPDKKIDIHLATTADTSGVEQAVAANEELIQTHSRLTSKAKQTAKSLQETAEAEPTFENRKAAHDAEIAYRKLSEELEELTKDLDFMSTSYREHIQIQEEAKKKAEETSAAIKEEADAHKENAEAIKQETEATEESVDNDNGEKKLGKFGKSLEGAQVKALDFAKKFARGGTIFAAITLLGDQLTKRGKQMNEFADEMDAAGTAGSRFVRMLGKSAEATGRVLNPIGAYIKSVKDLADAKKRLKSIEREQRRNFINLQKEAEKAQENLTKHHKYRTIAENNKEASDKWLLSLEAVSKEIDYQNKKLDIKRRSNLNTIDRIEQEELDRVDSEVLAGKKSEERGKREKFEISQYADQDREGLARYIFDKEQEGIDAKKKLKNKDLAKVEKRINDLYEAAVNILDQTEVKNLTEIGNANVGSDNFKGQNARDRIKAHEAAKENLANSNFTSKDRDEFLAKLEGLKEKRRTLEGDVNGLDESKEFNSLNEKNRRAKFAAEFQDRKRDEDRRRTRVSIRSKKEIKEKRNELKNAQIDDSSEVRSNLGELKKIATSGAFKKRVESLQKDTKDGSDSQEIQEVLGLINTFINSRKIKQKVSDETLKTIYQMKTETQAMLNKQRKTEVDLKKLTMQVKSNRI